MAAIARTLSRAVAGSFTRTEIAVELSLAAAAGLFVALMWATYGLDLSFGLF